MCFGFEHGNGWYDLVYSTLEELEKIVGDKYQLNVIQVKQKFGLLRIYVRTTNHKKEKAIYETIHKMEDLSGSVCENCGKAGESVKIRNYLLTLCKSCAIEIKKKMEIEDG